MKFGQSNLNNLVSVLFWVGNIAVAILSFLIGNHIYHTNTYNKVVEQSGNFTRYQEVNNLPLAIFIGIIALIVGIILWKINCEFIFIIMRYFKTNINCDVDN